MKNFKKVLSLTLALVMVLSTMTTAFAAAEDQAEVLYDLGLFMGYSDTEYEPGLEDPTDAAQALVLIGRALGWEVDEAATTTFTDVPAYAVPYVAYAVSMGITDGISETEFGVDVISGQRMVTWFLAAAGYDKAAVWADTETYAAEAGMEIPAGITRADVVAVIYAGLMVTPVDGDMTVIETLVGEDAALEAIAIAAGLMEEEPEVLAVVSATATNLKQVVVTFNKALDADEAVDATNYAFDDGTADLTGASFDLSDDAKAVTITLTDANQAAQQEDVVLSITDMMDTDETTMADTDVDVEFVDTTFPEAISAEVVGNDTIKVTFSEPVKLDASGDDFEVDGGDLVVQSATAMNNNTEINVQLYSDLETGSMTIEVANTIEDFAGFSALSTVFTVEVVEDTTAPVIVGYKDASETGVTLIFSEDIEIDDPDADLYYHTNDYNTVDNDGSNMIADTDYVLDGAELTLDFTTFELPAGTSHVYVEADAVNDLWDNLNSKLVIEVEVVADVTAPTVDKVEVEDEDQIKVTFSEDLDDSSYDKYSFTLLDEDGDTKSNFISSLDESNDDYVLVNFKEDLSGDYSIVVEEVADLAGNEVAKTTIEFNVDDLTKPVATAFDVTVYNAGAEDQMIEIDFAEAMAVEGTYSVVDLSKYVLNNNGTSYDLSSLDAAASIKAINDNNGVQIMIPSSVDDSDDGIDIVTTNTDATTTEYDVVTVTIARVADAADNYTLLASATRPTLLPSEVTYTAVATAVDTVVVTFDGKLSTFEKTEFTITTSGGTLAYSKVKTSTDSDGDSVVTYTLGTDLSYDALSSGNAVSVTATDVSALSTGITSENANGEAVKAGAVVVSDEITPALAQVADVNADDVDSVVATSATTIVLTFEEAIDQDTVTKLSFEVNGGTYAVDSISFLTTTQLELTLDAADQDVIDDLSTASDLFYVNVVQNATIKDIAGNAVSDITTSVAEK